MFQQSVTPDMWIIARLNGCGRSCGHGIDVRDKTTRWVINNYSSSYNGLTGLAARQQHPSYVAQYEENYRSAGTAQAAGHVDIIYIMIYK